MKSTRNIPASVRQRLLNRAKTDRRPFNELLQYYAMERFLYRFSLSVHADRFVLKGALMLRIWRSPGFRPTMDIDMLGITSNKEAEIIRQIQDILIVNVEPDGLGFDPDSIQCERITEDANYEGIRLRFLGKIENARIHMQLDIGFGDAVIQNLRSLNSLLFLISLHHICFVTAAKVQSLKNLKPSLNLLWMPSRLNGLQTDISTTEFYGCDMMSLLIILGHSYLDGIVWKMKNFPNTLLLENSSKDFKFRNYNRKMTPL
jgi:Nucleotidyl transferase AbiEii toxin, Type IV TA system